MRKDICFRQREFQRQMGSQIDAILGLQILDDLAASVESRSARDAAAGMRACTTEVETSNRRSVLRPSEKRPEGKELIEGMFQMKDVAAGQTICLLEVERSQNLTVHSDIVDVRRIYR